MYPNNMSPNSTSSNRWLKLLVLIVCAVFACYAWAAPAPPASASTSDTDTDTSGNGMTEAQFVASLHPVQGKVDLPDAGATLTLGDNYSFLNAEEAQKVVNGLWDNPPDSSILGLIVPGKDAKSLLGDNSWGVIVRFVDDGYVSDAEASKIDYDDMLKSMQKDAQDENEDRVKQGYDTVELLGWAEPPHYDAASHKLYWARNLKFVSSHGEVTNTLNYGIRVLGRKGYLSLDAVAPMSQLDKVRVNMQQVVQIPNFNAGQRYADYNSHTDKLATYGIAALIAGVAAKKLGLLAIIGAFLAKFIKIGIIAVVALLAKFKGAFGRKPKPASLPSNGSVLPSSKDPLSSSNDSTRPPPKE